MKTASELFNALPMKVRTIAAHVMAEHKLQSLLAERKRAIAAHREHLSEIDAHIKYVKGRVAKNDAERAENMGQ